MPCARRQPGSFSPARSTQPRDALLGFCMGAYRFDAMKSTAPARLPARLVPPAGSEHAVALAQTIWLVRDLINLPANVLGPAELAEAARQTLAPLGVDVRVIAAKRWRRNIR